MAAPTVTMSTPPIIGPAVRDILNAMLLSATALGTTLRGTISKTIVCRAGMLKAIAPPAMIEKAYRCHISKRPVHSTIAMVKVKKKRQS